MVRVGLGSRLGLGLGLFLRVWLPNVRYGPEGPHCSVNPPACSLGRMFFLSRQTVGPVTILSFLRRIFFKELVQCGPTASTVVWKSPWDPNSLDRATTCHRGRFLGREGEGVQGLIRWFFVRFLYPNLTGRVKYCFKPPLVYWVIAGVKCTPRLGLYK